MAAVYHRRGAPKVVSLAISCCLYDLGISGITVVHSVNGDIAIQWEWSNFDPSQNPNPLTDYEKNFAQLITSTRQTRNPEFVPIGRKGAPGEIREV